ncbi:MAG: hypothetical protein V4632_15365 [Pseudomonadota bacterium]
MTKDKFWQGRWQLRGMQACRPFSEEGGEAGPRGLDFHAGTDRVADAIRTFVI